MLQIRTISVHPQIACCEIDEETFIFSLNQTILFSFLTSREIFIVKEDLPLVLLKLYRNNIIIIFASKRFTLTCSTWHMKHKSQFISNKSKSGPLDWELNEEGLHIFLVLLEGSRGWKRWAFFHLDGNSFFIPRGFVNFRNSSVHLQILYYFSRLHQ